MMNCEQTLKNMADFVDSFLDSSEALELQRHLDSCPRCRQEFQKEQELLVTLRTLPVPPPSKDFVNRSFATVRARHQNQRVKQAMPYWGGAVAACLALWIMVAAPFNPITPAGQPAHQAINIRINEHRLVQVVVNAPRDMLQADVVIELPPEVEMAGFPGRSEIRWNTNLRKGKNLLSLPLIAKSEGMAKLITHINHENKSKMLSLVMNISHDEMTRKGQYMPSTA